MTWGTRRHAVTGDDALFPDPRNRSLAVQSDSGRDIVVDRELRQYLCAERASNTGMAMPAPAPTIRLLNSPC